MRTIERRYPVYVRRVPRTWWLRNRTYRRFFARELTSVFVGAFSVILLVGLFALSRGPEAYEGFLRWLALPGTVVLSVVMGAAALYHAVTWFRSTAAATVVRIGRRVVPRDAVTAGQLAVWIVVSAAVAYLYVWR